MATLSLKDFAGASALDRVRRAIADCKTGKSRSSQQRLYTEAAYWDGKSTKALFQRISCKYADNSIETALHACKLGKAAGPDGLSNDWYRAYASALIPLLALLFNHWYKDGKYPTSFLEANIFCLKKGGNLRDPLNYRPIALLNTDYKIFTRVLANRLRKTLPDERYGGSIAVMLDFKKAYDSLSRVFLHRALRRHGYPPRFVAAVKELHLGTSTKFLVNGHQSRAVPITSGIRQGCPLAPMLFVLAIDALYRAIDNHGELRGVTLQSDAGTVDLRVSGYADDTAIFLQTAESMPQLLDLLSNFGAASGLQLNQSKTMVVALSSEGPRSCSPLPAPLQYLNRQDHGRYLGIYVGSKVDSEVSWTKAEQQLQVRVTLASRKLLTVDQRSQVATAVIVPKLLYVGQHAWPSPGTVRRLERKIKNFIWSGVFTADALGTKAWIDADLAAMSRSSGGLGTPILRTELMALAATVVAAWARDGTTTDHIVGDILHHGEISGREPKVYVAPMEFTPSQRRVTWKPTMWATGREVVTKIGLQPRLDGRKAMVSALALLAVAFDGVRFSWDGHQLLVDGAQLLGAVFQRFLTSDKGVCGTVCTEWLPYLVTSDLRLYDGVEGRISTAHDFSRLFRTGYRLRDIVHWRRLGAGRLIFTPLRTQSECTSGVLAQLRRLAILMITNFPLLLHVGQHNDALRMVIQPPDHPYQARMNKTGHPAALLTSDPISMPVPVQANSHRQLVAAIKRHIAPDA
ncbi:reverse transcriptase [Phytophthora megakarya]|uniref:Reverse transcriptase n=1 Tax=Phytophthora megakarya TaxID=4795 RepID=A0A225VJK8_9STRA|nr:reverse transcriptase [Phytophthora megakarya]